MGGLTYLEGKEGRQKRPRMFVTVRIRVRDMAANVEGWTASLKRAAAWKKERIKISKLALARESINRTKS